MQESARSPEQKGPACQKWSSLKEYGSTIQSMLVTLGNHTITNQPSLIQTTSNVGRSSRINDHNICTNTASKINQMKVDTLTIDQSRVKDGSSLSAKQVTISRLPSASLSKLMNLWLRIAMQYLSCALVRGRGIVFRHLIRVLIQVLGLSLIHI